MDKQFTAIIEREGDGYVSLCPELDIASQGTTIEYHGNGSRTESSGTSHRYAAVDYPSIRCRLQRVRVINLISFLAYWKSRRLS